MNYLEKYTEEDSQKISYLPLAIGALMGVAGSKNLSGTKNMFLFSNFDSVTFSILRASATVSNLREEQKDNNLISPQEEQLAIMKSSLKDRAYLDTVLNLNKVTSVNEFLNIVIRDCQEVVNIIDKKEDQKTIKDYKDWLLSIALKVANESKEGSFLGFGGERFSKEERRLYKKIELYLK